MVKDDDIPLAPTRQRALLPAELELFLYVGSTVAVAVFGGGALSGLLALHGLPVPGWHGITSVFAGLWHHPGNPAVAWPTTPRPGPAWLTWSCVVAVAAAYLTGVEVIRTELAMRRRHRRSRSGMATTADLHRAGLDAHSAVDKARNEYPNLAKTSALPVYRRTEWGRRRR